MRDTIVFHKTALRKSPARALPFSHVPPMSEAMDIERAPSNRCQQPAPAIGANNRCQQPVPAIGAVGATDFESTSVYEHYLTAERL